MGSSSSKVAGKAAAAAGRRQYPSTASIPTAAPTPGPRPRPARVRPDPSTAPPSDVKSERIDLDGRDPQFAAALRKVGSAKTIEGLTAAGRQDVFPTSSRPPVDMDMRGQIIFPPSQSHPHSQPDARAITNPSLMIVQARERIGRTWDEESDNVGRAGFAGRTLISAKEIRDALQMRDEEGRTPAEIETRLRLRTGLAQTLGRSGAVANA